MPTDPIKAKSARGYLNNNPGNIDRSRAYAWLGEIRDPALAQNDQQRWELTSPRGRFCVFDSAVHGIRALSLQLDADHRVFGDRTVRQYIGHWAPPSDNNDTAAYIDCVCKAVGIGPDDALDLSDRAHRSAMIEAIIAVECGGMPYRASEIVDGLAAAGVS